MPRLFWMVSASLFFMCCAPVVAQEWTGYGELQGGGGTYRARPFSTGWAAAWSFAGSGHVNWNFAPGLNLQADIEGRNEGLDPLEGGWITGSAWKQSSYGTGAHFNLAGPDYRVGILGSIGKVDRSRHGVGLFSAGIEGAWYFERFTGLGQLNFTRPIARAYTVGSIRSVYLHTAARWFPDDNVMIEGVFGAGTLASSSSPHTRLGSIPPPNNPPPGVSIPIAMYPDSAAGPGSLLRWGFGGEYRLENWPIGIGVLYRGSYVLWHTSFQYYNLYSNGSIAAGCGVHYRYDRRDHLFAIRLRYYFDTASLIANDRNGAGTADYNPWYGAEPVSDAEYGALSPPPAC